jgi:hypothetical protein
MIRQEEVRTLEGVHGVVTMRQRVVLTHAIGAGCRDVTVALDTGNLRLKMPDGAIKVVPRRKYKAPRLRLAYWLAGAAGTLYLVATGFFARKIGAPMVTPSTDTDWIEYAAMLGFYLAPLIEWPTRVPRQHGHRRGRR